MKHISLFIVIVLTLTTWIHTETQAAAPTVTITPASGAPHKDAFTVTIAFSEAVNGFGQSEVTISPTALASVTDFSGSDGSNTYTATITPTTGQQGELTITVAAGVAQNSASEDNEAGSATVDVDAQAPTVTLTSDSGNKTEAFDVTITFSEPVNGFRDDDITFDPVGASVTSLTGPDGDNAYTATIQPKASGSLEIKVAADVATDAAGNGNEEGTIDETIALPMAIMVMEPDGQTGPYNDEFEVIFMVTETVDEFVAADITLSPSDLADVTDVTGSVPTFTATITPRNSKDGTLTISVAAGDVQNNLMTDYPASNDVEVEVDTDRPTVDEIEVPEDPQNGAFEVTITFSEEVYGFDEDDDIDLGGTATASVSLDSGSDGDDKYIVTITPSGSGTLEIEVKGDAVTDAAGNESAVSSDKETVTIDQDAPTVTISGLPSGAQKDAFDITITFSEEVDGFDPTDSGDLKITGPASATLKSGDDGDAVYTVTITPDADSEGDVTLKVEADAAEDDAGNGNTASAETSNIPVDTQIPTVTVTGEPNTETNAPFDLVLTFSEDVTGFATGDLTVTGEATATNVTGSGATYTVTITPNPNEESDVTIELDADAVEDDAGNKSEVTTLAEVHIDTIAPTVEISGLPTGEQKEAFDLVLTFSEDVTGFATSDLTVTGEATATDVTGSGAIYTATITPNPDKEGDVTVTVDANTVEDDAGNQNTASDTTPNIHIDTIEPTVEISQLPMGEQNSTFILVAIFSENVTGFAKEDLTVTGEATATAVSGSGNTYSLIITPNDNQEDDVTVTVNANAVVDDAGNQNTASDPTPNIHIDTIEPTADITGAPPTPQNTAFDLTITFNEDVTGFAKEDLTVTGEATATDVTGSGAIYTATITPNPDKESDVTVTVNANAVVDDAGNQNTASDTTPNIHIDTIEPTVTITDVPTTPQNAAFNLTVTFTEDVTGFATGGLTVTGEATATNVSGSGTTYTVTIRPNQNKEGDVTVQVNAGAATDGAGNANTASAVTADIPVDRIRPTGLPSQAVPGTQTGPFDINYVFSEPVYDFTAADADYPSQHVTMPVLTSGVDGDRNYTINFTPANDVQNRQIAVGFQANSVTDAAGNSNSSGARVFFNIDTKLPTVTITGEPTTEQNAAFDLTFTFNENVTGFTKEDLTVTGEATATAVTGSNKNYTVTITPNANKESDVTVQLKAEAIEDLAGNKNVASAVSNTVHIDTMAPTATISGEPTAEQNAAFDLTVTFDENVTGFGADDLTVTSTGLATATNVSGSGTTYTVTITPNQNKEGDVTVQVKTSAVTDNAGNANTASNATSAIHVDTIVPTATISGVPTTEQNAAFDLTITFNEAVTGFDIGDVNLTGPAAKMLKSSSSDNTTFVVTITPDATSEGDVKVKVNANTVKDAAENDNLASNEVTVHVDTIVPTVTISGEPDIEKNVPFDLTITFSEPVNGFAADDMTVTGPATATSVSGTDGDAVYTVTITPNTSPPDEGDVTVTVNANAAQDFARNDNTASPVSQTVHVDTIIPTVTISPESDKEDKNENEQGTAISEQFGLVITFSEEVNGFAYDDLTVTGPATASSYFLGGDGDTEYIVFILPDDDAEGDVTVQVNANAAQDFALNDNTASPVVEFYIDTIAPTVEITGVPTSPKNSSFDLTITFSEPVYGFEGAVDLEITGDHLALFIFEISGTDGDSVYTVEVRPWPNVEGDITVQVAPDSVEDAAFNYNTASNVTPPIHLDTIKPSVEITGEPTIEKNVPFDLTITFSEPVNGFQVPEDLTLTGDVATASLKTGADGDSVYTITITPDADSEGDVTVTVNANTVQDSALNDNTASPVVEFYIDTIVPTVEITGIPTSPKNAPFTLTVTFSEPVSRLYPGDLTITGDHLAVFIIRPTTDGHSVHTIEVRPNAFAEGDITLQIEPNSVEDFASNGNTASNVTPPMHVDLIRPTVEITGEPDIEKNVPFDLTVTFDEPVNGFQVPADLAITGPATASLKSGDDGDEVYTVTITPDADSEDDVTVKVNANTVQDSALNGNTASLVSKTVHVDTIIPTVAISGEPDDMEKNVPFDLTITFSEEVSGFQVPDDLTVTGPATATLASGVDSDAVYTVTITPNTSPRDEGDVTVTVNANTVQDLALNNNTASPVSKTVHVDTIIPTVAISGEPTIEENDPFDITITFSEPVNGFAADDLTVTGPATATSVSGTDGAAVYTATITPDPTSEGDVTVTVNANTVQDFALNDNTASPVSATIHVDTIVPTVAISDEPTIEKNVAFDLTITFSEPVNGFAVPADLTITNGNAVTASLASGADGDTVYTVTITPNADIEGSDVTVTVNANTVQDFALNNNTPSPASDSVHIDTRLPTVVFEDVPVLEKRNDVFDITVIFSEEVNGFEVPADMTIDGPVTASLTAGADGDTVYTVTITPNVDSRGDVTFQIPANTVQDFALNFNSPSTETDTVRIDTVPPVPEITGLPTTTQNAPFDITIDFNEQVNGFTTEDITVTGPATALLTSGVDGDVEYTVTITPNSDSSGSVTIQIPAGVVKDFANNDNTASEISDPVLISTSPLTVEITDVPETVQLGAFSVTIKFSEDVIGFELADIAISGDAVVTATELMGRDNNYMLKITPDEDTDGDVTIQVPANVAMDAAQNGNAASLPQTVAVAPSWMPNADLRAATRDQLNLASGADFDQETLENLTTLQSEDGDITDLTGLELATALTTLDLSGNTITDITLLSGLTKLTTLDLGGNTITDITSVAGLTELTTLDIGGNSITDITSLSELTQLTTLDLNGNSITNITSLAGLTQLTTLDLGSNAISSIAALVGLTGLTTLDLSGNAITDITPLAGMTQIKTLNLSDNSITNWGTLAGLTTLTTLNLSSNSISDLNIISNLTGLLTLNLSDNAITDLTPLANLTALTALNLSGNTVSTLTTLASLTQLTTLNLNNNTVSDLTSLGSLTSLTTLALAGNTISAVSPIATLQQLSVLDLRDNSISEVGTLSSLASLTMLFLEGNPILDTAPLYSLTQRTPPVDIDIAVSQYAPWDVNADGSVDAADSALVTAALGQTGDDIVNPRTDVNGDGTVDNADLLLVTDNFDDAGGSPTAREVLSLLDPAVLKTLDRVALQATLDQLLLENDGSLKYRRAIALLQTLLAALTQPQQTRLLANYPNPFNPETWIPYQLASSSNVQIAIYDVNGLVVRHLKLGHQVAGYYTEKQRAAYWDGRNSVGERVASGVYFYQLQADNVSLLRKMVILK